MVGLVAWVVMMLHSYSINDLNHRLKRLEECLASKCVSVTAQP